MNMSDMERDARSRVLKTFLLPWIPVIILTLIYIFLVENEGLATFTAIFGVFTLLVFIAALVYFMRALKSFRDD